MEEKNIIKLVEQDGQEVEAEVLLLFKLEENGVDYIIYTKNEPAENGLVPLYASEIEQKETGPVLKNIIDEDVWTKVKEYMRNVVNEVKE
jgi:uncharacterized protein YrzB (UPF0473 family)